MDAQLLGALHDNLLFHASPHQFDKFFMKDDVLALVADILSLNKDVQHATNGVIGKIEAQLLLLDRAS